ncbi:hypothetical protein sos41_28820 [Alphaproteobacteria bacterium SO-S41]|nr:hypothetical protein sos41_28820 [Alphaproteobacteria bacterium SO-S41]
MALKFLGDDGGRKGFDFRNGFAYQMVPAGGATRSLGIMTDHSDWIMAPNTDKADDGTPLSGPQTFAIAKLSPETEALGGAGDTFRLPANTPARFRFTGGMAGQFEYKLQPVNKHTAPVRLKISVLPRVAIQYHAFVLKSDAKLFASVNTDEMIKQFETAEAAYKDQCNVDLQRQGDAGHRGRITPLRSNFNLGSPIILSEMWERLKVEIELNQPLDQQWMLKVIATWNVISGEKKTRNNKWIDDAVGVAYVGNNVCFCQFELGRPGAPQAPEWTTIAHEIGHTMGLKHTEKANAHDNIMFNGNMGAGVSNRFTWYQIEKLNGTFARKLRPEWFDL